MQFSAMVNRFIVKTELNSTFTNDLKRFFFSKNVHIAGLVSLRLITTVRETFSLRLKNTVTCRKYFSLRIITTVRKSF